MIRRWELEHAERGQLHGINWWESVRPDAETLALLPGLGLLTTRELEILLQLGIRVPSAPGDKDLFMNLKDCVERVKINEGFLPCICPGQLLYSNLRHRCVTGTEALRAQGLVWAPGALQGVNDRLQTDLAGNAFNAHCSVAVTTVALLLMAACLPPVPLPAQTTPPPEPMPGRSDFWDSCWPESDSDGETDGSRTMTAPACCMLHARPHTKTHALRHHTPTSYARNHKHTPKPPK